MQWEARSRSSAPASPASSPRTCCTARTRSPSSRPAHARRAHEHDRGRHAGRDARRRHRLHRLQRPQLPAVRAPAGRPRRRLAAVSDMSFSVSDERGDFEYNGSLAQRPVRQARAPGHARGSTAWSPSCVRFNRDAPRAAARRRRTRRCATGCDEPRLLAGRSSTSLIVPQAAAVWSADPRQMWTFPARFLAEFFDNHGMLGLRDRPQLAHRGRRLAPLRRGADRAVARPPAPRHAGDRRSSRHDDHVEVTPRGGEPERFDHVVLGHALRPGARDARRPVRPRARDARRDPLPAQRGGPAHRRALLPRRRRAWASWNYHLLERARPARRRSPTT